MATLMMDSTRDDHTRVRWREEVKRGVVRLFDSALVAGTPQREYLRELGFPDSRIFEGYDVVDNDAFVGGDRAAQQSTGQYFLVVSRFIERKNLYGLIDAYKEYRSGTRGSRWGLTVVGDGPLREGCRRYVQEEGIGGLSMPGSLSNEEIVPLYHGAGAFIHPALQDQWGLVVNEAMAASLPIIVSRQSGCARDLVIEGFNGFTLDASRGEQLTGLMDHMARLRQQVRSLMGRRSRELIVERFSPETFANELLRATSRGRRRHLTGGVAVKAVGT
jgi:glycosyltransferase involved in cell wall biosynthesis